MSRKILIAGILFYVLIIPFFYHTDIKEIYFKSQYFSQGILNIYSFIEDNSKAELFGPFAYQPLTYYVFGLLFVPIKLLAGLEFQNWLAMGNDMVGVQYISRYLFLMKVPMVVVFSITGYFLSKLFSSKRKSNLALLLWFYNPISIYVVGLVGQFDVFPVFLTVLALYFAPRKPFFASILLGLGAAMKGYPLFLIPFLAILIKGSAIKRISVLFIGVLTYFVFILPFVTDGSFYTSAALSGLSQRLLIPGISLGFEETFMFVPGMYLILILLAINDLGKTQNLYKYFFTSMFLISAAVHFHAQWALWFLPFLIVLLVNRSRFKLPFFAFSSVILILSYFATVFLLKDRFLSVGLLSIFDASVFFLPSPFDFISKFYDPFILQSIFHSFYLVSGFAIATKVMYEKNPK